MNRFFTHSLILIVSMMLASCATSPTRPSVPVELGQEAWIHYTCRLSDDEVAASTRQEVAEDDKQLKSNIFRPNSTGFDPIKVVAGGQADCATCPSDRDKGFVDHIASQLEKEIVGMQVGDTRKVAITADEIKGLRHDDRYLQFARRWQVAKKEKISRDHFVKAFDKQPILGDEIVWHRHYRAEITQATDNMVYLDVVSAKSKAIPSIWGPAVIKDRADDHFDIELEDLYIGRLVRLGPLVGSVSEIGDKMFTTDFGYPFGGQALSCDIELTATGPAMPQTAATGDDAPTGRKTGENVPSARTKVAANGSAAAMGGFTGNNAKKTSASQIKETPGVVQAGDLVYLNYTARLSDGRLLQTTVEDQAAAPDIQHSEYYRPVESFTPVGFVAGNDQGPWPGVNRKTIGLEVGEKKTITLMPGEAFGPSNPNLIRNYPRIKKFPRLARVDAETYSRQFKSFPQLGQDVDFTPYYKSRVVAVNGDSVTLEAVVSGTIKQKEPIGETSVTLEGDEVVLALTPAIGAPFELNGQKGRITAYNDNDFTVDFNQPLAGEAIVLDIEVVSVAKASTFENVTIDWILDHDQGILAAEQQGKPVVLVLYAGWCGWSKKLLTNSLNDPRIKLIKGQFIWVKVDSDKNREYHELYQQNGYPLIVLLDQKGDIIERIDGYLPGDVLSRRLAKSNGTALEKAQAKSVPEAN